VEIHVVLIVGQAARPGLPYPQADEASTLRHPRADEILSREFPLAGDYVTK
jgi:hypothetical protein